MAGSLMQERTAFMRKARERLAMDNPELSKTEINKRASAEWLTCPLGNNAVAKMSESERKKRRV